MQQDLLSNSLNSSDKRASLIMVKPVPNSEDVVFVFPPLVRHLGDALEPVAKNLRQAITCRVKPSGHEFLIVEDLLRHSSVIHQALTHLSDNLDYLRDKVLQNERAGVSDGGRAAGMLEQVLSEFVNGYKEVKSTHCGPESSEARKLLLGVYRHHIREVSVWLNELVQTIASPESAVKNRGVALTTTKLTVVLKMTSPPGMAKLAALAKRLQIPPNPLSEVRAPFEPPEPSRPGILGTIGALAFGFGVSKAIFGRHHG